MLLDLLQMLKIFQQLKNIRIDTGIRDKFKKSDEATKRDIYKILAIGLLSFLIVTLAVFFSGILSNENPEKATPEIRPVQEIYIDDKTLTIDDLEELNREEIWDLLDIPDEPVDENGQGLELPSIPNPLDLINPFSGFQESIRDAFSEIIQQGLELFDDYVAFTPNIAKSDGEIVDARGNPIPLRVNKFYNASQTIAFLLLPLVIVLTGVTIVLEGRIKGMQVLMDTGKKVLLFMFAIVSLRFVFSLAIDLNNAIAKFVLQNLVGLPGVETLSESLLVAFGMNISSGKLEFSLEGALNLFGEIILWIALFFLLMTLLFQFVIRFFHLLIHLIMAPIVLLIALLPGGGQFFKTYLEEVLRTLFMQPIFLVGIGIALEVISSVDEPVPKIVLGLGALSFLNIIPAIVNRFSGIMWGIGGAVAGGILTASTIGQAGKIKQGLVQGVSGGKSGSIRNLASRAIGEKVASALPGGAVVSGASKFAGGTTMGGGKATSATLMKGQQNSGTFKQALKGGKADSAFKSLGMKPLAKDSLVKGGNQTLNKIDPDFSGISKVSLKDSENLSSKFISSNYDSYMGDYPLVEGSPSLGQLANVSDFKAVNPQTHELMNSVLQTQPIKADLGNTFDSSNDTHWNHLTEWYAKNESKTTGKPLERFQTFANNPANKMDVVRRASSEGYFKSQGINTVKLTDNISGENPVTKYYQIQKPKKLNRNSNAGNRTTKTK